MKQRREETITGWNHRMHAFIEFADPSRITAAQILHEYCKALCSSDAGCLIRDGLMYEKPEQTVETLVMGEYFVTMDDCANRVAKVMGGSPPGGGRFAVSNLWLARTDSYLNGGNCSSRLPACARPRPFPPQTE